MNALFSRILAVAAFPLAVGAAEPAPADIYETSFEQDQGYNPGWVQDQAGWTTDRTVKNPHEVDVITGGGMDLPVPHGAQMLRSTGGVASTNRTFTTTPLDEVFSFSILVAQIPDNPKDWDCKVYFGSREFKFAGFSFGLGLEGGAPVFYYQDGDERPVLPTSKKPEAGVFYRFEGNVDIKQQSYTIKVFLQDTNELLGEAGGQFRLKFEKFDNLLIGCSPTTYIDDIRISSQLN